MSVWLRALVAAAAASVQLIGENEHERKINKLVRCCVIW